MRRASSSDVTQFNCYPGQRRTQSPIKTKQKSKFGNKKKKLGDFNKRKKHRRGWCRNKFTHWEMGRRALAIKSGRKQINGTHPRRPFPAAASFRCRPSSWPCCARRTASLARVLTPENYSRSSKVLTRMNNYSSSFLFLFLAALSWMRRGGGSLTVLWRRCCHASGPRQRHTNITAAVYMSHWPLAAPLAISTSEAAKIIFALWRPMRTEMSFFH